MKENTNIEELFKEKFNNFEGNVDPSAWANISQSIGAGAAGGAGSAGLSGLAKVAIIAGTIAVTSVSVWYFSQNDETAVQDPEVVINDETSTYEEPLTSVKKLVVEDSSDPLLHDSELEIQEGLGTTPSPEYFEQEVIDQVLSNENTNLNNGGNNAGASNNNDVQVSNSGGNQGSNNVDATNNGAKQDDKGTTNEDKPFVPDVNPIAPNLEANFEAIQNDKHVDFNANARDHQSVTWDFGDGTTAEGDFVSHEYERPGVYSVEMLVSGHGSVLMERHEIVVEGTSSIQAQSDISNVITPNNDLKNDFFSIKTNDISSFKIVIRDMSGKEVFSSDDPDFEWNGEKYDGSIEKGNYIYTVVAEGEDGAIFKRAGKLYVKI